MLSRGLAEHPPAGPLTHTVPLAVYSCSPAAGSLGGGTELTVTGSGFPASLASWANSSVLVQGWPCRSVITDNILSLIIMFTF